MVLFGIMTMYGNGYLMNRLIKYNFLKLATAMQPWLRIPKGQKDLVVKQGITQLKYIDYLKKQVKVCKDTKTPYSLIQWEYMLKFLLKKILLILKQIIMEYMPKYKIANFGIIGIV